MLAYTLGIGSLEWKYSSLFPYQFLSDLFFTETTINIHKLCGDTSCEASLLWQLLPAFKWKNSENCRNISVHTYLSVSCVSGKMAMISGFILLCVLQAAVPQHFSPRGPRPVPLRGDSPEPTPPPLPPWPTPKPEGCESELLSLIET